jgi:hypothetical protein
MRRFLRLFSLLVLLPVGASAQLALSPGEAFTYKVGWGVFIGAGEIKISAQAAQSDGGESLLRVVTTTATRGVAKVLYTFEAHADALFDAASGRLISTTEISKAQMKENRTSVAFDYAKLTATYVNETRPDKSAVLPLPAGHPMDLITSLVQTRSWELKPGEKRDALVLFDDEFYELTIYAEGYEEVRTALGTFNTLLLVPRMEKTAPKGMFKKGSQVRVWISQDERHLPVKFQVDFKFGAGIATLTHYEPPAAASAAAGAAKPAVVKSEPDAPNPRS